MFHADLCSAFSRVHRFTTDELRLRSRLIIVLIYRGSIGAFPLQSITPRLEIGLFVTVYSI